MSTPTLQEQEEKRGKAEFLARFKAGIAKAVPPAGAAKQACVSVKSVRKWVAEDRRFAEEYNLIESAILAKIESTIWKIAEDPGHRDCLKAAIFILCNAMPESYQDARRQQIELTGAVVKEVTRAEAESARSALERFKKVSERIGGSGLRKNGKGGVAVSRSRGA